MKDQRKQDTDVVILYEDFLIKAKKIRRKSMPFFKKERHIKQYSRLYYDTIHCCSGIVLPFFSKEAYDTLKEHNHLKKNKSISKEILKSCKLTYDHIHKPQLYIKSELEKFLTDKDASVPSKKEFAEMFDMLRQTVCVTKDENLELRDEKISYGENFHLFNDKGKKVKFEKVLKYETPTPVDIFSLAL